MMRGTAAAGGRQEVLHGTLLREFRGRWTAGSDTWNTFAGIPWQVDGGKRHLVHFCVDTVSGGRRKRTPGTLLRGYRARWEAEKDTWYTFAWIPCQVGGGKGHLVHFCVDTVPGGRRKRTPDTLSREFRARWTAGRDTWNAFAGKPCQADGGKRHLERFRRKTVPGGTHRQGHTVALRRSFPQCGPLPFSGADAGFDLCMSLSSRMILAPDVLT